MYRVNINITRNNFSGVKLNVQSNWSDLSKNYPECAKRPKTQLQNDQNRRPQSTRHINENLELKFYANVKSYICSRESCCFVVVVVLLLFLLRSPESWSWATGVSPTLLIRWFLTLVLFVFLCSPSALLPFYTHEHFPWSRRGHQIWSGA